ncbi:poly [ADP-ribose] polymerase tankyrase-1-like [Periplaneta americana]|uniref:poly [ADP-ribose] polymerase tankyrase-1-like n=1 Tax=Periplaneta americana TaxID=6978 RepID=UPI0037E8EE29
MKECRMVSASPISTLWSQEQTVPGPMVQLLLLQIAQLLQNDSCSSDQIYYTAQYRTLEKERQARNLNRNRCEMLESQLRTMLKKQRCYSSGYNDVIGKLKQEESKVHNLQDFQTKTHRQSRRRHPPSYSSINNQNIKLKTLYRNVRNSIRKYTACLSDIETHIKYFIGKIRREIYYFWEGAVVQEEEDNVLEPVYELFRVAHYDPDKTRYIVQKYNVDLSTTDKYNDTLLQIVVRNNYVYTAMFLIEKGANVNVKKSSTGRTALMEAAERGYVEMVKLLLNNGSDVTLTDKNGNTAMHYAAKGRDKHIVQMLVLKGANLEAENSDGETPLSVSESAAVTRTLIMAGALPKRAHLVTAAEQNDVKTAELLLNNGADPNLYRRNKLPLSAAVERNNVRVAKILLELGANVDGERDLNGNDLPLALAARNGHLEIAQLLLEKGSSLEINHRESPLHIAVHLGRLEFCKLLISYGASPFQKGNTSKTPYEVAVEESYDDIAHYFIGLLHYNSSNKS